MDLNTIIYIKKLLFAHTIIKLDDGNMIKNLFKWRARSFNENINKGIENEHQSPLYEILRVSRNSGLYEELMQMIFGCTMYNKI